MINITVHFDARAPIEMLETLANKFANLEVPMSEVGELYSENIANYIDTGTFTPLSDVTIAKKGSSDMLKENEDMYGAVKGAEWVVSRVGDKWQATLELPGYSAFHWTGTTFMPKRDFVDIPWELTSEIEQIFADWLSEGAVG